MIARRTGCGNCRAAARHRKWPPIAWAVSASLAFLVFGCDGDSGESTPASPDETPILFRFEAFTKAPRSDGGEIAVQSLMGKVVLVDIFGTWCAPCRRSAPVLVSLYERYHDRGFEVVGLAYEQTGEPAQSKEAVEAFRREFNIPYVLALGPKVAWDELRRRAGFKGTVPTMLLMDRQSVVRDMFEGLPPGHEALLADRIERLLAEPVVMLPGQSK